MNKIIIIDEKKYIMGIDVTKYEFTTDLNQYENGLISITEHDYHFTMGYNANYFIQSDQPELVRYVQKIRDGIFTMGNLDIFHTEMMNKKGLLIWYVIPLHIHTNPFVFRPNSDRGFIIHNELFKSYRCFNFEAYRDPRFMNWNQLKTLNDDRSLPGFETSWHEHKQIDILGYVIKGQCYHKDSIGNIVVAKEGQIQHMWCGDSIWHSEANNGEGENRYLQIWIMYEDNPADMNPKYTLVDRLPGFNKIHIKFANPHISVFAGIMDKDVFVKKNSFLFVIEGICEINNILLKEGDSMEVYHDSILKHINAHLIMFHTTHINRFKLIFPERSKQIFPHPNPLFIKNENSDIK